MYKIINMDKLEYRAVIRFLVLEGITPAEIQTRMAKVYGELSPSPSTIKKWAAEFKRGRTSIKDDPREGRPKCATGSDVVQKVSSLICQDKRLKVREIADVIEVSTGSTFEILTKQLNLRKLYGSWVPIALTTEEKAMRKKSSEFCLQKFQDNDCIENLIAMGESWIHIYEQQIKSEGTPSKLKKASASNEKVLALVFWDTKGVLFTSYAAKDEIINADYMLHLLKCFNQHLNEKRPNRLCQPIYFYPDMFQIFNDQAVLNKLNEFSYKLLVKPMHSPDLSPSDSQLFPKLENFIQAKRPQTVDEAIEAVEHYFYNLPQSNYRAAIEFLEKRFRDCIALEGNYVESNSLSKIVCEHPT